LKWLQPNALGHFRWLGFIGPRLDEPDHVEQILAIEPRDVSRSQLSRQCGDNLFAAGGSLLVWNALHEHNPSTEVFPGDWQAPPKS
jgi:hypothetical protein